MLRLAAMLSERDEHGGGALVFGHAILLVHAELFAAEAAEAADVQEAVRRSLEDCAPTPADPALVAALGACAVPDSGNAGCCAVCLEPLLPGQRCPRFRCGHLLHLPCAAAWLQSGSTCPVCMQPPWIRAADAPATADEPPPA